MLCGAISLVISPAWIDLTVFSNQPSAHRNFLLLVSLSDFFPSGVPVRVLIFLSRLKLLHLSFYDVLLVSDKSFQYPYPHCGSNIPSILI